MTETKTAKPAMLPLQDAVARLLATISPRLQLHTETLSLSAALDRTLAADVVSPLAVPLATNSAMDGYALRFADVTADPAQRWPVVGQSLAGHPFAGEVPPGCCIRITTGAVVPDELDTVVMQEDTQLGSQSGSEDTHCIGKTQDTHKGIGHTTLVIKRRPVAGQHIRLRGSELEPGQLVLQKGTVLGPLQLGLLATLGIASVPVFLPVRVGVLSSGDELKQPGETLRPGDLFDSNRIMLLSVLQRFGCAVTDLGWVADDPLALRTLLQQAAGQVDVIVTSGGVSVGDADYTRQVLTEMGQMDFWQVAIKPGKPFAFGWLQRQGDAAAAAPVWLFGLPGNPVSAAVTCEQLLLPALKLLSGQSVTAAKLWPALAGVALKKKPGRLDMQRVSFTVGADGIVAEPVGLDSSGMLTSLLHADALLQLEQERGDVVAGEPVLLQPKSHWWL